MVGKKVGRGKRMLNDGDDSVVGFSPVDVEGGRVLKEGGELGGGGGWSAAMKMMMKKKRKKGEGREEREYGILYY